MQCNASWERTQPTSKRMNTRKNVHEYTNEDTHTHTHPGVLISMKIKKERTVLTQPSRGIIVG